MGAIAEVHTTDGKVFTLEESGKWSGDDQSMVRLLNTRFALLVIGYGGPDAGKVGWEAARDAAKFLHGKLHYLLKEEPADPNVVY